MMCIKIYKSSHKIQNFLVLAARSAVPLPCLTTLPQDFYGTLKQNSKLLHSKVNTSQKKA